MATVTITTTAPQDTRLAPAFGAKLNLGQNATTAQVKTWLIEQLRNVVQEYEDRINKAAVAPPANFDPS